MRSGNDDIISRLGQRGQRLLQRARSKKWRRSVVATGMLMSVAPILPPGAGIFHPGGQPSPTPTPTPTATSNQGPPPVVPTWKDISYSQPENPMGNMWDPTKFNPSVIDADLAKIQALNANTVRIFVQPKAFGYPEPLNQTSVNELKQVMQIAARHNLKTHITLFDDFTQFDDIAGSERWLDLIVGQIRGNPSLAFWEVHNEIVFSDPSQRRWLGILLPRLQNASGGAPVTSSVLGQIGDFLTYVNSGEAVPDFYSYHNYNNPSVTLDILRQAKAAAATRNRNLMIGEAAYGTGTAIRKWDEVPTRPWMEAFQEQAFRQVAQAARDVGLSAPPGVWELFDRCSRCTDEIPTFGIYHDDRTPKPAVATIASIYAGNPISQVYGSGAEGNGGGYPAGWRVGVPGHANFGQSNTVYHGGTHSGYMSQIGDPDGGGTFAAFMLSPISTVAEGTTHTLSAWVKGTNANGTTRLELRWYDGGERHFATDASINLPQGTTGWTQLSVTATAPQYTRYVMLGLASCDNTGTVYFDDVTLS